MVKAGGLQLWVWALLDEKDIGYVSFEFLCSVGNTTVLFFVVLATLVLTVCKIMLS